MTASEHTELLRRDICQALLNAFPMDDKQADAYAAVAAKVADDARSSPTASVAWACVKCNSPRSVDPCPKCGTPLTKPADGWDWPTLPDIDRIRALAREVGYAVGVHGSLERDLDLIAAPWVADAVGPLELAQHIAAGLGGEVVDFERQDKPCGRWSCNIHTPDWTKMIDLSVMPPLFASPTGMGVTEEQVERVVRSVKPYTQATLFVDELREPFKVGEMVLHDVNEGLGHRVCFGEDREAYVKDIDTGEPLGPDDPIPEGWPYGETAS